MKKIVIYLAISILPFFSVASTDVHVEVSQTTTSPNGRYEIIQSSIVRRLTFRVDKANGMVSQLVKSNDGSYWWSPIERQYSTNDTVYPGNINYQMFLGGFQASDAFLINVNTGETWMVVRDKNDDLYLELMK